MLNINSEGSKKLEFFIDNAAYKELFDDVYYEDLVEILQEIESFEISQKNKIEELEEEVEELKSALDYLKDNY